MTAPQPPVSDSDSELVPVSEGQQQAGPTELNLDWAGYLKAGEYRRALAAARVGNADVAVQAALEDLHDLQEAVRARRLGLASRLVARLGTHTEEMQTPADFRRALDLSGLDAGVAALLAADQERLTDEQTLTARLQPALHEGLTRAEALNTLGVLHALQDREGQARQAFGEAFTHDPGHYRALTNLGNMALEGGDAASAEKLYKQATALNGDYAGAHHNLGVALRKLGRLNESVSAIKRGQRLSVRQTKRDQDDELKSSPGTQRTVQLLRLGMIILVVVLVLLAVRGRF
ncbi:tetratricopeptide repeat protein [Deinococcus sp.]|uniref:tetratricopeptide repeat protein n=1 Tax=Deinococcus sp. TaxID=47478 RepID=UPI003C7D5BAC